MSPDPWHDMRVARKSLITFIVTTIATTSSFVISEHAIRLLSTLNNDATF